VPRVTNCRAAVSLRLSRQEQIYDKKGIVTADFFFQETRP
jgi:hypothetical protein